MDPSDQTHSRSAVRRGIASTQILLLALALLVGLELARGGFGSAAGTSPAAVVPLAAQTEIDTAGEADSADVAAVAELANPAVVTVQNWQTVSSRSRLGGGSSEPRTVGSGSGFIVDAAGYVVTNHHVVAGAEAITVVFADGTEEDAEVLGSDPFQDVAVLQLDLDAGEEVPGVLEIGESDGVEAGDVVVAIGTALGEYANTVTSGVVNATDRALDTGAGYALANLLEHDAELWSGNSGGPVLNLDGEVIGMNVAAATSGTGRRVSETTGSEIGFAIEIDAVMALVEDLIPDGIAARPFLGIGGEAARGGHLVTDVVAGGAAEDAGIAAGDLIVGLDGDAVGAGSPLLNRLFAFAPGDTVELTVERDGEAFTVAVTLDERPAEAA